MTPAARTLEAGDQLEWAYATLDGLVSPCPYRATVARSFLGRFGSLDEWRGLTLIARYDGPGWVRSIAAWAALTGRLSLTAEEVHKSHIKWANLAASMDPAMHGRFVSAAAGLGFRAGEIRYQWNALAKVAAVAGTVPAMLTPAVYASARNALLAAAARPLGAKAPKSLVTPLFGLDATAFHLGIGDPHRQREATNRSRDTKWAAIATAAPQLVATLRRYVDQMALSLRPGTIGLVDTSMRMFATYLVRHHAEVTAVADVKREHVEGYKAWLPTRPGRRGKPTLSATCRHARLSALRSFFERVVEWGWDDTPTRPLVFRGDLPILDEPLPRFLDDGSAAKLLRAARSDLDPLDRLVVELLARTGMRRGELLSLTIDGVVQIGSAFWLRIPVGKLHNDRYIPLHPSLKQLLDDWLARRPEGLRSNLMFLDRGRPLPGSRVDAAVRKAARLAGIGHVTPHQLRHTLATQAINRGMSLEAIAALLGHRDLSMTMIYARISDRTVADEYFAVTEKVEALYEAPKVLPPEAEGRHMRAVRAEIYKRMLGNGYCTRPAELDCRFESICEGCQFFATGLEFLPTLERQRDDAFARGQTGRQQLFEGLLTKVKEDAS